jgi:hypothetical protein
MLRLEVLEDRTAPSVWSFINSPFMAPLQQLNHDAANQWADMQHTYSEGLEYIQSGNNNAAIGAFYWASWDHGYILAKCCASQAFAAQMRTVIIAAAESGWFDPRTDFPLVMQMWNTIGSIDNADNSILAAADAMWNQPFPSGWLYAGIPGADSLSHIY